MSGATPRRLPCAGATSPGMGGVGRGRSALRGPAPIPRGRVGPWLGYYRCPTACGSSAVPPLTGMGGDINRHATAPACPYGGGHVPASTSTCLGAPLCLAWARATGEVEDVIYSPGRRWEEGGRLACWCQEPLVCLLYRLPGRHEGGTTGRASARGVTLGGRVLRSAHHASRSREVP